MTQNTLGHCIGSHIFKYASMVGSGTLGSDNNGGELSFSSCIFKCITQI